ncbi:MAG: thioredoxin [Desulfobacteraceae bacterium]|nr:MAG: thioredoxin [Desulfobacteraceae bacterium]
MRTLFLGLIILLALFGMVRSQFFSGPAESAASPAQPETTSSTPGRVTMIDLGATSCIPCKMMAPILEELKKEYAGKADIIFIDVWKDPAPAKKYGIRAIPTQIFFDSEGREFFRHTGFMDKKQIIEVLSRMGVS